MRLAPQIIQSIEILQLASLDLQDLIQQELVDNPVLEIIEGSTTSDSGAESDGTVDSPDGPELRAEGPTLEDPRTAEDDRISKEFEKLVEMEGDAGYNELFGSQGSSPRETGEKDRKLEAMQNSPARAASLSEHLFEQFGLRDAMTERLRDLGREIIFNLDERGFLRYQLREIFEITDDDPDVGAMAEPSLAHVSLPAPAASAGVPEGLAPRVESIAAAVTTADDTAAMLAASRRESDPDIHGTAAADGDAAAAIASPHSLGPAPVPALPATAAGRVACTRAEANDALRAVQQLEPRGVGARSLQECLLLQLELTDPDAPLLQALLTRHLDDVLKNRVPKISRELSLSIDEVNRLVLLLKTLSIRPGAEYAPESSPYIMPDVLVDPLEGGEYEVKLEDDYLPPLRINGHYRRMLREVKNDPATKQYLQKKIEAARWLIDSIEQRRSTLLRVSKEIVGRQKAFLDHGISHHRPLKMQEVADELGIHVSTVSRAISGKHVQTHRGIYPLKFFFSGGTETVDGSATSRAAVKDRVEEIVGGEDSTQPLSDDDIAARLKDEGLSIARRTVTKYRKMLGIPSSRQRKVFE